MLQLAEKFARKAALRESWLNDMTQVLEELDKGQDVSAVDAALKRHEAISADVHAGVSFSVFIVLASPKIEVAFNSFHVYGLILGIKDSGSKGFMW